jgi:hypothetical protein
VRKVVAALEKMLTPLYCMGQKSIRQIPEALSKALFIIVTTAGHLSREMRRCADVIYHWLPTFKDGTHSPDDSGPGLEGSLMNCADNQSRRI